MLCFLLSLKPVNETCYVYMAVIISSGPFWLMVSVEDIDLRVTRQEGPGYSNGHCQKPDAKLKDGGPKMGLRPGGGLKPVVTIIVIVDL